MDSLEKAKKMINESNNIVFFGGAGVSTASGIPDFRSATGLYNKRTDSKYSPEYMLSIDFFENQPEEFQSYTKEELMMEAKPNAVHKKLAKWEEEGRLKGLITQNIDSLHQKAGSKKVIEIHGNLRDFYCPKCFKNFTKNDFLRDSPSKCDSCNAYIRPEIVLYGEPLDQGRIFEAVELIAQADCFIIGGTSLMVYPAAGLIDYYKGQKCVLINRDPTPRDQLADVVIQGDLTKTFKELE